LHIINNFSAVIGVLLGCHAVSKYEEMRCWTVLWREYVDDYWIYHRPFQFSVDAIRQLLVRPSWHAWVYSWPLRNQKGP
jgi:hypothetical protein